MTDGNKGTPLNFMGLSEDLAAYDKARAAVLCVPYEATTTYGHGTGQGPAAILEASQQVELYDEELDAETCEIGIATVAPFEDPPKDGRFRAHLTEVCDGLLSDGKFVVSLGGEHTISAPLVEAFKKHYPNLWVLQLDAHSDLRDRYQGSPWNHACVMARIAELCPYVGVGIRSGVRGERGQLKPPSRLFYAHEMRRTADWPDRALEALGDPVYVTIDLDFFDPADAPSVGTPEPGGFHWYETLAFLRRVIASRNVVGFDVVELSPKPGFPASDFLAAKLVYKLLGYKFIGRPKA